ncbi:maleylpyruvate isomerase family mycothiol-dependent enzyme [Gordonia sp. DT219]|uniref:maleylpyruvate isomerase family mycothiol-dependent enzyme n=1 Tax=Gordonia sp. DT219 TaxID=3416658 RepID=UPI003CF7AB47
MPATSIDPSALIPVLIDEWGALRTLATELGDRSTAASILPGWTNADIIAHIIGTESMLEGRDVDAPADIADRAHVRNPIGELNEKWVEHFRGRPASNVLDAFDEIVATRSAALQRMSQADFDVDAQTPAGPDTYGRFMRIRLFDCWIHEVDLRDGGIGGTPSAEPVAWVLDEITASLPYVVGKRAQVPMGSAVIFEVTGAAPRTVRIAVAERAGLVDSFDGGDAAADVVLELHAVDLVRLAGGRRTADPSAVTIRGDDELAQAILARIDYLI